MEISLFCGTFDVQSIKVPRVLGEINCPPGKAPCWQGYNTTGRLPGVPEGSVRYTRPTTLDPTDRRTLASDPLVPLQYAARWDPEPI
jgi:hypothetical protein